MTDLRSPVPEPAADAQSPGVSRALYGMPMFATLVVADIAAAVSWYTGGLGFIGLFTLPGPGGQPVLVHLRRWQFQDLLVRPAVSPVSPGSACTLSFAAVYGELDQLAAQARAHGGGTAEGPADTPWNTRDLVTTDPDGNRVIFTAARPPGLADGAFTQRLRTEAALQGLQPG